MVRAKSLVHVRPAGPTLSPFHRLTLLMHVSQLRNFEDTPDNILVEDCQSHTNPQVWQ